MKPVRAALASIATTLALGGSLFLPVEPAVAAGMPVFDATNYTQNLIQAARALDQINNQVKSLQNEASMLQNMARNLQRIDFPQLEKLRSAMQRIDTLMGKAQGVDFRVEGLDQRIRALFPGELGRALGRDRRIADARARLDAAMAGYRQSMGLQAQVAQNLTEDAAILGELSAASQGSTGALEASQAANQIIALSVKQQLQLQSLMAAEFREQSIERARRIQAEADGRSATRRFLGATSAATPRD